MERPVTDFTDIELKSFKCDIYEQMEQQRITLEVINNELASRAKKAQENKNMEEQIIEEVGLEAETQQEVETAE